MPRGLAAKHRIADRLVYSKVQGAPRRPAARRDLRRRAARARDRRVLPRARHPHPRGLRADRVHDGRHGQPARPLPLRHGRAGHAGRRACDWPTTARCSIAARPSSPATSRTRRRRARCSARTAGCTPATSATIDDDGFVTITDRKKDIIVTAGGKNVAPQNLENELKTSQCVSQALVVGDRRPYVAALITLDEEELAKWAPSAARRRRGDLSERASARARPGSGRRRQRGPVALRAGQALRDPAARLLRRRGRDHADAEAEAPRRARSTSRARSSGSTRER